MRTASALLAGLVAGLLALFAAPVGAADRDDATARIDQQRWARWQGRLNLGTTAPAWRLGVDTPSVKLSSASLMGDYYFFRAEPGGTRLGGFRATSGLVIGPRGTAASFQPAAATGSPFSIGSRPLGATASPFAGEAAAESATVPYLGLGYTGLAVRSRLSFSADLGLAGHNGGGVRLGRAFNGTQNLDDAVRELRLAPLLQFGVSYAF